MPVEKISHEWQTLILPRTPFAAFCSVPNPAGNPGRTAFVQDDSGEMLPIRCPIDRLTIIRVNEDLTVRVWRERLEPGDELLERVTSAFLAMGIA